jgi:hypothetical protein
MAKHWIAAYSASLTGLAEEAALLGVNLAGEGGAAPAPLPESIPQPSSNISRGGST